MGKKVFSFFIWLLCLSSHAQVIENPVFDRIDQYRFRVNKVEITDDTTYVYCLFQAEEYSWANISKDTFLEDVSSGIRLPLLKTHGLPFSPEKRHFIDADTIQVILCFPHVVNKVFNIIENENEKAFNIYGINLNKSFTTSYSYNDIVLFGNLAISNYDNEDWNSAILYTLKQLEASKYLYGMSSVISCKVMYDLTLEFLEAKKYGKVIEWGDTIVNILNLFPKDSLSLDILAKTYGNIGAAFIATEQFENGISFLKEALKIREAFNPNSIDYYLSLKGLYKSYIAAKLVDGIKKYGEILVDYMEKHSDILGDDYLFYPIETATLAAIYNDACDSEKTYSFIKRTLNTVDLLLDYPAAYVNTCYKSIICLNRMRKDSLAYDLCQKVCSFYEGSQEKDLNTDIYTNILLVMSNHYYDEGDFYNSRACIEKAIRLIDDKNSIHYGTALSNLAVTYSELGLVEESIILAKKAVELSDSIHNIEDYANKLINLCHCLSVGNKPKEALLLGKLCYNFMKEKKGFDNYQTLLSANNLATYYDYLGYHEEMKDILLKVIDSSIKDEEKYADIIGCAYNNLAMNRYASDGMFEKSLYYINKAYEIRKKYFGDYNIFTINSLYNKGRCLLDLDKISEGSKCINDAMRYTRDIMGVNNLRYIEMMKILPVIYARSGDLKRALRCSEERSNMLKEIVTDKHILYLHALDDLSELYFYTKDTTKLFQTIIEESRKYKILLIEELPNYTTIERKAIIEKMTRFFDRIFPQVCYYNRKTNLYSELYNAILLRKGILLNSEIEFNRRIRESGDTVLVRHYNNFVANKNLLNKQYQLSVEKRTFDIDSLKTIINEEEDYLVKESKEYGDYTKHFRINWKDIRDKLKVNELSVEFVDFNDTCTIQNRIYYALVIDKYSESPELIPLCNEKQILEATKSNKADELYRLIWYPILEKKKNVNTIFFSPSGILNNIGIEYVKIHDLENISDRYEIYRLSSTREIVKNEETACKSAALYGGLDYSVDTDILLAQNDRLGVDASSSVLYRGLSDSLYVRNSFVPLYNTKTEIAEIDKTLKKGNVAVFMYCDAFGTEESFKALSGKGMNLIHLATHGMYIGASEAESKKRETNLSFILLDDNGGGQIQEDISLSRSFLVMSGGDMLPTHKVVPDNLEDGILTASEISKLDLRGLCLVVLSACQTGLGDVDNEGVYGLQRGFKKAGTKTILMSLDRVDDEATKILMVDFYKNLMSGQSKHQSLKNAQKHLRSVENGKYDDPKYWASFIMLDGIK